jgi:hypothetical protein
MDRWGAPHFIRDRDPTLRAIHRYRNILQAALDGTEPEDDDLGVIN